MFKIPQNLDYAKFSVDFLENLEKTFQNINYLTAQNVLTYNNFVRKFMKELNTLDEMFILFSHLHSVKNSTQTQKTYEIIIPKYSSFSSKIGQNSAIFAAVKNINDNERSLNIEQKKVLEDLLKDFRLNGVHLSNDQKKELSKIDERLSLLQNQFSQNVLDDMEVFEIFADERDVLEVPKSDLALAKCQKNGQTKYKFTLQFPSFTAYMTYGNNPDIRKKLYRAFNERGVKNDLLMEEILSLRSKKAKLLGFKNYAQLSIEKKTAKNVQEVQTFLQDLSVHIRPKAQKELELLKVFTQKNNVNDLQPWDLMYYSQKLKEQNFGMDEEAYRPYFEQNAVVLGLFEFLQNLFEVQFKKVEGLCLWDEKAQCFDILKSGAPKARLFLDLEARSGKKSGAWMQNYQTHHLDAVGKKQLASAFVVCNFPPSNDQTPSLLRHNDVVTLFHEMGHAIHHLFSEVKELGISGIEGVAWDVVEFTSQFLENFAYEKKVLQTFAKHHETGEILSDLMCEKLKNSANFQRAMALVRQLEFGLFDLRIHQEVCDAIRIQQILDAVRQEVAVVIPPKFNKFQNAFTHIFSGGYAAGYYSYMWADVASADAFYYLIDSGFDCKVSQSYYENILCDSSRRTFKEQYESFRGRMPRIEALFRINGLK